MSCSLSASIRYSAQSLGLQAQATSQSLKTLAKNRSNKRELRLSRLDWSALISNNESNLLDSTPNPNLPESDYVSSYGGAIYNKGTTTIENSTFENNTATGDGGAIYWENRGESPHINLNIIRGCSFVED